MSLEKYRVTGMSCAACQARVEKAVNKVPGVESVAVSLLTGTMGVEGSADPGEVVRAVEKAGYGASRFGNTAAAAQGGTPAAAAQGGTTSAAAKQRLAEQEAALADTETPVLRRRLIASVCILILLMYGSMGHTMWHWPLPPALATWSIASTIKLWPTPRLRRSTIRMPSTAMRASSPA